jgi:hypothetical protein
MKSYINLPKVLNLLLDGMTFSYFLKQHFHRRFYFIFFFKGRTVIRPFLRTYIFIFYRFELPVRIAGLNCQFELQFEPTRPYLLLFLQQFQGLITL